MLGLVQRMTVQQVIDLKLCQELQLTGGDTETIFPEVEALLQSSSDIQHALDLVAKRKNAHKYRSVMDFLFCEMYPEWKSHCFRYYLDGKEAVRHVLTMAQRQVYAWELCQALNVAYKAFCEKRALSWASFREEVLQAIA
jgi:hypothetical protein